MSRNIEPTLPPSEIDCKWWMRGYCFRGESCYFRHSSSKFGGHNEQNLAKARGTTSNPSNPVAVGSEKGTISSQTCSICFETPDTYGLLMNCEHAFCLECIRNWRATAPENPSFENELKTTKMCPMCRSHSAFIVPSAIWPSVETSMPENMLKKEIVDLYLGRLKTIPCRYFEESIERSEPDYKFKCKFGNNCHYSHIHPVTKEQYVFSEEELRPPPRPRRRNRAQILEDVAIMEMLWNDFTDGYLSVDAWFDEDEDEGDDFGDHLAFEQEFLGISSNDFDDFGYDYGWD